MPDEVTYDSEINQPVHKPGMENVVNRADARDASGNRLSDDRPQAGEADAATRHQLLEQALKTSPAPKGAAAPAAQSTPAVSSSPGSPPIPRTPNDGSGSGGRRREQAIMDEVQKEAG